MRVETADAPDAGFLVGFQIKQINDSVRVRFEEFLYTLG